MTELLAPAGDLICAKTALYNGADAIYCASEAFGARAYAKNLNLDELKELLILAHSLDKKSMLLLIPSSKTLSLTIVLIMLISYMNLVLMV